MIRKKTKSSILNKYHKLSLMKILHFSLLFPAVVLILNGCNRWDDVPNPATPTEQSTQEAVNTTSTESIENIEEADEASYGILYSLLEAQELYYQQLTYRYSELSSVMTPWSMGRWSEKIRRYFDMMRLPMIGSQPSPESLDASFEGWDQWLNNALDIAIKKEISLLNTLKETFLWTRDPELKRILLDIWSERFEVLWRWIQISKQYWLNLSTDYKEYIQDSELTSIDSLSSKIYTFLWVSWDPMNMRPFDPRSPIYR